MKKILGSLAAGVVALVAACGGNVVVDTAKSSTHGSGGSSGLGGMLGSGGVSTQPGPGVGGSTCLGGPNPGTLVACGGTGSATSGGATMCIFDYCDPNNPSDTYEATCSGKTCVCTKNGAELCTCALTSPGDVCSGGQDCCFH